jgi:hypothetical protein
MLHTVAVAASCGITDQQQFSTITRPVDVNYVDQAANVSSGTLAPTTAAAASHVLGTAAASIYRRCDCVSLQLPGLNRFKGGALLLSTATASTCCRCDCGSHCWDSILSKARQPLSLLLL